LRAEPDRGHGGQREHGPEIPKLRAGDYRLFKHTPCADKGLTNVWRYYRRDINNDLHTDYNHNGVAEPDMGCFEHEKIVFGSVIILK